jgi:hypothetical protein
VGRVGQTGSGLAAALRHHPGGTDPDRDVNRRLVAAIGVLVAAGYLAAAALSARLDPLAARPILDGLAPPPAYEWVDPPAALASTNKTPYAKTVTLSAAEATYDTKTGSAPGVYATDNYQATLSLAPSAIAPKPGAKGVELRFVPDAPDPNSAVPDGYQIAGNIIEITATYQPSGDAATDLSADAQLMLAYPAVFGGIDDEVLTSIDGRTWKALPSTNHLGQQLVVANIKRLGFFAVGQTAGSGPAPTTGGSEGVPIWVVVALGGLAVLAAGAAIVVRRGGSSVERERRPPSGEDDDHPFDSWRG